MLHYVHAPLFSGPPRSPISRKRHAPTFPLNREIVGIFLITLAVLVFLSLWSFSLRDVGWFALPESETVEVQGGPHNLVGLVGAYIAASLIWVVGSRLVGDPVFNPVARDSRLSTRTQIRQKSPGLRAAGPVYEHARVVASPALRAVRCRMGSPRACMPGRRVPGRQAS